jgi:hypothetical protein
VVVLIVGIALGAGAFWIWGVRSSRRARKSTHLENNLPSVVQGAESSSPLPIFASYSYQDMVRVDPLVEKIEGWGFGIWIDRNSSGSERYAAKIGPAIRTSKVVALMCSKNAFASDHVIREVYMAGKFKKPFLSFLLDRTELPDEINYFISPYPLLPVTTMHESELKSAVEKFLESEIN